MTIPLPAEPLSLQASAAWSWLMRTAEAVGEALRGQHALSPVEARLYATASELGAHVLDAQDVVDLHARIYAIARDPRFILWEVSIFQESDRSGRPAPGGAERIFAVTLGPTQLAQECARLLAARLDAVAQVRAALGDIELPDGTGVINALTDFRTPPVLRSLLEETVAGEVALLALLAPLIDAERWPCPAWLRLALLEQIRLASVSHLRLLSILPDITIPLEVLPLDEHLDPRTLDRESSELARHVLPAELPVGEGYVVPLREMIEGDAPVPAGVRALFAD